MGKTFAYDVTTPWEDPYDSPEERRAFPRAPVNFDATIGVTEHGGRRFVGPGRVRDIGLSGVAVLTKHRLLRAMTVEIAIPATSAPPGMCLPDTFRGFAKVMYVAPQSERVSLAGLQLDESFSLNMEFVSFVNHVHREVASSLRNVS